MNPDPCGVVRRAIFVVGFPCRLVTTGLFTHLWLLRIRRRSWSESRPESRTAFDDARKVGLEHGWERIGAKLALRAN